MASELPDLGQCQCCENEPSVGVAAIPGVPMSITWGEECLKRHATPLWVADITVGDCCNPQAPSWSDLAEWFREQLVYLNGQYVRVDTLTLQTFPCDHMEGKVAESECMMCFHGQIVGLAEFRLQKKEPPEGGSLS